MAMLSDEQESERKEPIKIVQKKQEQQKIYI